MSKKLLKAVLAELQALRVQMAGPLDGVKTAPTAAWPFPVTEQTGKKSKKSKKEYSTENSPTLYRYIRPTDCYGEIDSQKGVTLKLALDYKNRVVNFSYAICNHKKGEPSFSKKEGQRIVATKPVFSVPLWDKPGRLEDNDITSFVLSAVASKTVDIPPGDRKNLLEQFENSNANFSLDYW